MHKPSIKSMQIFLEANGYNIKEIEAMSRDDLFEIYRKKIMQEVSEFQQGVLDSASIQALFKTSAKKDLEQKVMRIQKKARQVHYDIRKIYDLIDEFIEDFSLDELRYFIFNNIKKIPSNLVEKVIQIKYYQYQSLWLDKIEENLSVLPSEERYTLMAKYSKFNINNRKLYQIYKKSFDQKELNKMAKVAKNKLDLLNIFSPQELEENYRVFYNESEEKIQIIDEILGFTHSYTRNMLKKISMEQLINLRNSIKNQMQKEVEERKIIVKYLKILENSMHFVDEAEFQSVCIDAINNLTNEQLQKVIETLTSQNKFFASKFENVARQIRGKIKAKIF